MALKSFSLGISPPVSGGKVRGAWGSCKGSLLPLIFWGKVSVGWGVSSHIFLWKVTVIVHV